MMLQKMHEELLCESADSQRTAKLLGHLAFLRAAHPTDAQLAAHLIEQSDGEWRVAFEWLAAVRKSIGADLKLLAMAIALEGKEREQAPNTKE